MDRLAKNWRPLLLSALLGAGVLAVFWPLVHSDFIKLDDGFYVAHNPHIAAGLTQEGVAWAFRTGYQGNWHPLTWLSHMLDAQLFGLNPGWHHLINLVLHAANTVLLFWLLRNLTGNFWRSGCVAALFALHPLHVESVAWISKRKDVLSTLFFLLSLLAYERYARAAGQPPGPVPGQGRLFYALTLLCFALGLMSKPMLVTLPLVLLLLDFWPLERFQLPGDSNSPTPAKAKAAVVALRPLLLEKIPVFVLSIVSSLATLVAQSAAGATAYLHLGFGQRVANAVISYWRYVAKTFWPVDLAVYYPLVGAPGTAMPIGAWQFLLASSLLAGISGWVLWRLKKAPWFAIGWFWYLGTLVPVIGLIQVGGQAMADRYTYIPLIGLFMGLVWGAAELAARRRPALVTAAVAGGLAVAVCVPLTRAQVRYWNNNLALFQHTLTVTGHNALARYQLGIECRDRGSTNQALDYFKASVADDPSYAASYTEIGAILEAEGRRAEALQFYQHSLEKAPRAESLHARLAALLWADGKRDAALSEYQAAAKYAPASSDAHYNLALALAQCGRFAEAAPQFAAVLRINPADTDALACQAETLMQLGRMDEAERRLRELAHLRPTDAETQQKLGVVLNRQKKFDEALAQFRKVVTLKPDWPAGLNALAWLLATHPSREARNGAEAAQLAERACALTGGNDPRFLGTLDAAYAENGRFEEAIQAAERTRQAARAAGQAELAQAAEARIEIYRARQPFHQ
jgi:tetratricopeptide (TPR) repeat protein